MVIPLVLLNVLETKGNNTMQNIDWAHVSSRRPQACINTSVMENQSIRF
jgi:hypothetical protein